MRRVFSALSHSYERHADDLFDEAFGAEVDALEQAGEAAAALRACSARLRDAAAGSRDAIGALRAFGRRCLYLLDPAEIEEERRRDAGDAAGPESQRQPGPPMASR